MSRGILIVVSGPSGTGKGTICQELLRSYSNLNYSISATTRMPRTGEKNGLHYWFLERQEFQRMIDNDEFLEWAEVYGNYYGTPRRSIEKMLECGEDVILEIDTQGAMQVKDKCPEGVFIYILPPSLDELAQRIYKRGTDSLEVIKKRLSCAQGEIHCALKYHYVIVNDDLEAAVQKAKSIIQAEKCRMGRNTGLIDDICHSVISQEGT